MFQGRQPGGKGFSEKVLVRIDPVALTGFQDAVDGGIRGTQARIGLLVFKFQDLGVISIGLGTEGPGSPSTSFKEWKEYSARRMGSWA